MSGRGGARGRGGRGGRAGRTSGGRGNAYMGSRAKTTKVGLCKDLEGNVFDFGTTSAADQMRITQEKIAQYIGAKYGEDIANELQNKTTVVLPPPTYSSATMTRHALRIALVRSQQATMNAARLASRAALESELAANPRRSPTHHRVGEAEQRHSPRRLQGSTRRAGRTERPGTYRLLQRVPKPQ